MRIALVSSTFPSTRRGGVPTYVEGRRKGLGRRHDVQVFALGKDPTEPGWLGSARWFPWNAPLVWFRLLAQLWRFRPALMEVHNIPVGLPAGLIQRGVRYFFHGPAALEAKIEGASRVRSILAGGLETLMVMGARRIHFASRAFRARYIQLHPRFAHKASSVIHPVVEAPPQAKPWAGAPWPNYLVCVRRLVHRMGIDLLLEAFDRCQFPALEHPVGLVIVGEGPMRPLLEAQAEGLNSRGRIQFLGFVEEALKEQLFAGAIASVVPSRALEGFGLVVVEAALQGCPTVATAIDGLPEAVESLGGAGRISMPTVEALIEALESLGAPQDRSSLRERALQTYAVALAPDVSR